MTHKGTTNPEETTLAALTGDSGPLSAGAQADGDKNAWEGLMEAPLAKRKAKPRTTAEPAAVVEPKTAHE